MTNSLFCGGKKPRLKDILNFSEKFKIKKLNNPNPKLTSKMDTKRHVAFKTTYNNILRILVSA